MFLKPLYEKIVIEVANKQEVVSETGLSYIKDMSITANNTMVGNVIAVGEGRLLADGQIVPLKIMIGDKIIFSKMSGESYNDGKNDYIILSEQNVLAVIKGENII